MPPNAPSTTLDALLAKAENFAEFSMRSRGRVPPSLMAMRPNGLIFFAPPGLQDDRAKDGFANIARLICVAHAATAAVLVLESWMTCTKHGRPPDLSLPPSEAWDRQEIVLLAGETRSGPKQKILPIIRTDAGGFFGFGEGEGVTQLSLAGRFAQILPPRKPPVQVQRQARMLLSACGITFGSLRRDVPAG